MGSTKNTLGDFRSQQNTFVHSLTLDDALASKKTLFHSGWLKKKGNYFPYNWRRRYTEIYTDKTFAYYVDSQKKQYKGEGSFAIILEISDSGDLGLNVKTPERMWNFSFTTPFEKLTW